jgi:hypothetical protein
VFEHAPLRTHFDPTRQKEQLRMLLPGYDGDGEGQPSPKRNKLPGGGFAVRTYQRSQQSDREEQVCVYVKCGYCGIACRVLTVCQCQFVSHICSLTANFKLM